VTGGARIIGRAMARLLAAQHFFIACEVLGRL
jgi:NAD(P)-dependent dehydrogenase (short-subunit alcohol dehydrogenase family)